MVILMAYSGYNDSIQVNQVNSLFFRNHLCWLQKNRGTWLGRHQLKFVYQVLSPRSYFNNASLPPSFNPSATLLKSQLIPVTNEVCSRAMEEEQITRTMLCAANEKQGADTCAVSVKNDRTGEKERKRERN